jgi:tetratricopeptide (TPR) repeat protein/transcriptional regulator with XRE-family HTH domain
LADPSRASLATVLKQLRVDAGMTQEELAEAATISTRTVSDLERGVNRTARRQTARLLASALGLDGTLGDQFEKLASGRPLPSRAEPGTAQSWTGIRATQTLPRRIAGFTGRRSEMTRLLAIAAADKTATACAICGMAGVGKTAFALQAAHLLAERFPDGQIYLPLYAHSPVREPTSPAEALAGLLLTAGLGADQIPPDADARSRLWRDMVADKRLLLVLDDAAGHEQIMPLLPGTPGSLVLLTSRLRMTALADLQTLSLDTLSDQESAELLARLADRPDIDPSDPASAEVARMAGHLPLAISMIARRLHYHPTWTCRQVADDMAAASSRLGLMRAENLSVAVAFNMSYQRLPAALQRTFRRLGLFPGIDMNACAVAALAGTDLDDAQAGLEDLYDQHLLKEIAPGRYQLHDLIREHAMDKARRGDPDVRREALQRLADYYFHATRLAAAALDPTGLSSVPDLRRAPIRRAPELLTPGSAVRWFAAERENLVAIVLDASRRGDDTTVIAVAAAMHTFLRRYGQWGQAMTLHGLALASSLRQADPLAEAIALTNRGTLQQLTGDYAAAMDDLGRAVKLFKEQCNYAGEALAANEMGAVQERTGRLDDAIASHRRALALYGGLDHQAGKATSLDRLGVVWQTRGNYQAAYASHSRALRLYRDVGYRQGEAGALNRLGAVCSATGDYLAAVASHEQALVIYREIGYSLGEAAALNRLGAALQATGENARAAQSVQAALQLFRRLGHRIGEAHALNVLGAVQSDRGEYSAALASHERALWIYRNLGHGRGEARALAALANLGRGPCPTSVQIPPEPPPS